MSGYRDLAKLENTRNCLRRIARHDEPQFSKDSIVNVMERFVKTVNIMDNTILVPCRLMDRQVGDSTDIIPAPGKDSTSNQHTLQSSAHGKRGAAQSKNVHEFLTSSELFNLYSMLRALKNDLLWTGKDENIEEYEEFIYTEQQTKLYDYEAGIQGETDAQKTDATTTTKNAANNNNTTNNATATANTTMPTTAISSNNNIKGHVRRPSTASVASLISVSNLSDAESEISNENDSGVESDGNKNDNDNQQGSSSSSADSISSSEDMHMQKKNANSDKATELAKRCKRHLNGLYQCLEQMTEAANYLTARYQSDIGPV